MINRDFIKGFAAGVGVAVVVPVVAVAVITGGRPLTRALSRGGSMMAEKAREAAAEAGEIIGDLIAETRADLDELWDYTTRNAVDDLYSNVRPVKFTTLLLMLLTEFADFVRELERARKLWDNYIETDDELVPGPVT